jgi:hypothetical protein
MSSWVHEITINFFSRHFRRLFDQAFSQTRRDRIQIFTGLQMDGFAEEYQYSEKVPDIGIFLRNDDDAQGEHDTPNELKWALEVGFSEEYDDLREDLQLWLIGQPTCSMAVLINITESPTYRCPLDFDLVLCDQLNIPQNPSQITETDFTRQGEYGPVTFKGHQWVGQISEVFLEIWTRNPRTGLVRRRGHRMSILPADSVSPQFQLADFLFIDNPQMTSFDWDVFRTELKRCLRSQAAARCRQWLLQSRKRAGYEPHRPLR